METTHQPITVKYSKSKAKRPYKLADGTPVPGVTTALGAVNKPFLLEWAYQCGLRGEDYKKVRDNAADVGSLAHFMVETYLKGQLPDLSDFSKEDISKAESCFIKFMEFWDREGMTVEHSEVEIVSESMQYGGKLDIIAIDKDGKRCLVDLKTSKAIYANEYWAQVAAYRELFEESYKLSIDRKIIVRIGKGDTMDLEVQELQDLSRYYGFFLAALRLYNAQKALKT